MSSSSVTTIINYALIIFKKIFIVYTDQALRHPIHSVKISIYNEPDDGLS